MNQHEINQHEITNTQLEILPFNYNKFTLGLYNIIPGDDYGIIEKGCCVSSLIKMPRDFENKNKSVKWNCKYHQAFLIPLLHFCLSQVVHPINLQNLQKNILTSKQKKELIHIFLKTLKSCPVCDRLSDEPEILKPYYRLPNNCGTIIQCRLTLDKKVIEYDIKSDESILIDTNGYRGTGLYVLHKNGFSSVHTDNYYPIWQLHKNYITPHVIDSFYDNVDVFKINDYLTIYTHVEWHDTHHIDKNINKAVVIPYNEYDLNKNKIIKMIDENPVLINYEKSKLFIQKKDLTKKPTIYVASFYDKSKNINFYFLE